MIRGIEKIKETCHSCDSRGRGLFPIFAYLFFTPLFFFLLSPPLSFSHFFFFPLPFFFFFFWYHCRPLASPPPANAFGPRRVGEERPGAEPRRSGRSSERARNVGPRESPAGPGGNPPRRAEHIPAVAQTSAEVRRSRREEPGQDPCAPCQIMGSARPRRDRPEKCARRGC